MEINSGRATGEPSAMRKSGKLKVRRMLKCSCLIWRNLENKIGHGVLATRGQISLQPGFFAFFLADALADFELHLARFLVGIRDDVIAVQNFAVENLQRQRILHQLLKRTLQRTCPEVGIVALSEDQFLRGVSEFDRNLAISQ